MSVHILYLEIPAHHSMEDIYNTKSRLDYHLHMLSYSPTAVSVLPGTSNFYISAFVRYDLHYKQAQEDLPIDSSLC